MVVLVALTLGASGVAAAPAVKAGGKCTKAQAKASKTVMVGNKEYLCVTKKIKGKTAYRWILNGTYVGSGELPTNTGSTPSTPAKTGKAPVPDLRMEIAPTTARFDGIQACEVVNKDVMFGFDMRRVMLRFAVTGGKYVTEDPWTGKTMHVIPTDKHYLYYSVLIEKAPGDVSSDADLSFIYFPVNQDQLLAYHGQQAFLWGTWPTAEHMMQAPFTVTEAMLC